jgi:hypothetical protein
MAIELHSNAFPPRRFLTLSRAINFRHDEVTHRGYSDLVKFWFVDTLQEGNKEVKDPTGRHGTVYVHGGASLFPRLTMDGRTAEFQAILDGNARALASAFGLSPEDLAAVR